MSDVIRKFSYSVGDVASVCDVPADEVRDWLQKGNLKSVEVTGGHKRIPHQAFESFLNTSDRMIPSSWKDAQPKCRILVVEDDVELIELLLDILRDEPEFIVETESDGIHAVLKACSWKPDLIMLDFVIPGLNGFEVCKRLRGNTDTRDTPVLAVTSLGNSENKQSMFDSGVSDYLPKPFYSEDLLKRIRSLLLIDSE